MRTPFWLGLTLMLFGCLAAACELPCGGRCMRGGACVDDMCVCPDEARMCGGFEDGYCAVVADDVENCGACGNRCAAGKACASGACEPCADGESACGSPGAIPVCVDISANTDNCGACGTTCDAGLDCIEGICTLECDPGLDFCTSASACVDLTSDQSHCGICDSACPTEASCESSVCACFETGFSVCGDACVDLQVDSANCGTCGNPCAENGYCHDGECACGEFDEMCGDLCVAIYVDSSHCGGCDIVCGDGELCDNGTCACPDPRTSCGETCADLTADAGTCGACETACATGEACNASICQGVTDVAAGETHTCAVLANGRTVCWGKNSSGQLGRPDGIESEFPRDAGVEQAVTGLAPGLDHTCALTAFSTAVCWGGNTAGQLGDGSTGGRSTPGEVMPALVDVVQVVSGSSHTCARLSDGTVSCWGLGASGQLGADVSEMAPTPTSLVDRTDIVELAVGQNSTCIVSDGAGLRCFGGMDIPNALPDVPAQVAVGFQHACGQLPNRTVACWGVNTDGQLGLSASGDSNGATIVPTLNTALEIHAGRNFSCAVLADRTVTCWGQNDRGQLGRGVLSPAESTPAPVSLPADTQTLSVGANHACALGADGVLRCWGAGEGGQLGQRAPTDSHTPVEVIF